MLYVNGLLSGIAYEEYEGKINYSNIVCDFECNWLIKIPS